MKLRLSLLAIVASLAALALTTAVTAEAAPPGTAAPLTTTLTGTAADATGTVIGTVDSVLTITGFSSQNGQLVVNGTLTSTITNTLTGAVQTVTQAISAPITAVTGTACQILHLDLGPLDLNLLGLVVHLNEVVLDITAQPGAGNLLGNLLCAVANLLNNPAAPSGGLAGLLNTILGNL